MAIDGSGPPRSLSHQDRRELAISRHGRSNGRLCVVAPAPEQQHAVHDRKQVHNPCIERDDQQKRDGHAPKPPLRWSGRPHSGVSNWGRPYQLVRLRRWRLGASIPIGHLSQILHTKRMNGKMFQTSSLDEFPLVID
jgi:hypothetical protein